MFAINKINFPIYTTFIILSVVLGIIFISYSLYKNNVPKKDIFMFTTIFFIMSIFFGKLYTFIEHGGKVNLLTCGPTGYGGLIGGILTSIIYEITHKKQKGYIKYTIISLPLIYGFAKLACFFYGCCYGIPYNGPFSVIYPHIMNTSLFPIQLLETIIFIIIFEICNRLNKNKNIIYITLILVFIAKFLLDFLRYSHIDKPISNNQIVSVILLIITLIIYKRKKTS